MIFLVMMSRHRECAALTCWCYFSWSEIIDIDWGWMKSENLVELILAINSTWNLFNLKPNSFDWNHLEIFFNLLIMNTLIFLVVVLKNLGSFNFHPRDSDGRWNKTAWVLEFRQVWHFSQGFLCSFLHS